METESKDKLERNLVWEAEHKPNPSPVTFLEIVVFCAERLNQKGSGVHIEESCWVRYFHAWAIHSIPLLVFPSRGKPGTNIRSTLGSLMWRARWLFPGLSGSRIRNLNCMWLPFGWHVEVPDVSKGKMGSRAVPVVLWGFFFFDRVFLYRAGLPGTHNPPTSVSWCWDCDAPPCQIYGYFLAQQIRKGTLHLQIRCYTPGK